MSRIASRAVSSAVWPTTCRNAFEVGTSLDGHRFDGLLRRPLRRLAATKHFRDFLMASRPAPKQPEPKDKLLTLPELTAMLKADKESRAQTPRNAMASFALFIAASASRVPTREKRQSRFSRGRLSRVSVRSSAQISSASRRQKETLFSPLKILPLGNEYAEITIQLRFTVCPVANPLQDGRGKHY